MRNLTKFLVLAALLTTVSTLARADQIELDQNAVVVQGALGAISTDTPILLRYVGSSPAGGTVTVAAGGDITLKTGPVGSSTADATTECPVSGGLGGIIDVSDTACNTLGEVCDAINLPSSNWRCVILDGLRSDSSDDTLATLSETAADSPAGLGLLNDGAVSFKATMALTPERTMDAFIDGPNFRFHPDPYRGWRYKFMIGTVTDTFGSGTSTLTLYSVKQTVDATTGKTAETVTTLYSVAGGATTVAKTLDFTSGNAGIYAKKDEKLIFRLSNSAALSAVTAYAYGYGVRYR